MNESVIKTIGVAFAVCLVCSLIVSASAVSLREQQKENKLNDRRVKILEVANIKIEPDQTIAEAFKKLEQKFVDFNTGKLMDEYKNFNIDEYDQLISLKDSSLSSPVPKSEDIAIIKNRENVGKIFILRDDDNNIDKLILPIRGYGLWGTLEMEFSDWVVEEIFLNCFSILTNDYKFTDPGALYYLNAKAGRWLADQIIEKLPYNDGEQIDILYEKKKNIVFL